MTIEQLNFVLTVAKFKNFSEAANELFIAQPTLSKQIKAVEKEVGLLLFDRSTRNIKITSAGKVFCNYAQQIVMNYSDMLQEINVFQNEFIVIKIATIPVLRSYNLFESLDEFQAKNPDYQLEYEIGDRQNILNKLRRKTVDMAILRSWSISHEEFYAIPILYDEIVLVVSTNHPIAKRKNRVSLVDVADDTFLFTSKSNTAWFALCIEECGKAGFFPKLNRNEQENDTVRARIKMGEGITMMAHEVAKHIQDSDLHIVRLKERSTIDLSLVLRQEKKSESVDKLVEFIKGYRLAETF